MDRVHLPSLVDEAADGEDATSMGSMRHLNDSAEIASTFSTQPYLIVIAGAALHHAFSLGEGERVMGRTVGPEGIQLPDAGVSRAHARITFEGGDYMIEDLKSANGTFLNGKRIQGRYRLNAGDRIRLGPAQVLRFDWPTANEETSEAPTSTSMTRPWSPKTWRNKTALQLPDYADQQALGKAIGELARLPPLVTSWEIHRLKEQISAAQRGERFLLQGGDCAETFADCDPEIITSKLKILAQMSLVLTHAARKPIIRVGRLAGQYAKPRSQPTETRNGVQLPNYLGDLVNRPEFTLEARRPDPQLLVAGYQRAAVTLNFIRSLCSAGFSDLRRPGYFDLSMFEREELPSSIREDFSRMKQQVSEGLHFLRAIGDAAIDEVARVEFFTSHEALNLYYEEPQTRRVPNRDGWYCLTTHLPWIGERTRHLDGAHIEFFRGVVNPIGIKIGPSATPTDLIRLVRTLNPNDEPGKIVLIIRMGAGKVAEKLPPLIEAIQRARRTVLWVTDPMHGNGTVTKSGIKTRLLTDIFQEIEETFDVHEKCGTVLGGIHFELTGDHVTECIGGGLTEADLDLRYLTACDPRLNYLQAMEMAYAVGRRIAVSSVRRSSSHPPPSRG